LFLGLILVAAEWTIAAGTRDPGESVMSAIGHQPNLWVINAMPLVLGLIGAIIGGAHAQLAGIQAQTQDLAERVAREWTAEIHEGNVNVAKTAELRSKFFAALSHDMRTPLTTILGLTDLTSDSSPELDRDMLQDFMKDSTGLGLPVSLGMAQAMGGTIQADSLGEGHGSTFRLVLNAGSGEATELKMASLPQLLEV
jgi:signal transduction histidine kinase